GPVQARMCVEDLQATHQHQEDTQCIQPVQDPGYDRMAVDDVGAFHRGGYLLTSRILISRVSASVRTRNSTRRDLAMSSTPLLSRISRDEDRPLAVTNRRNQATCSWSAGRLNT